MDFHRAIEVDDTMPTPGQVERQFLANATQQADAVRFLDRFKITSEPVLKHASRLALIDFEKVWNPESERYEIHIQPQDATCNKPGGTLAVPVFESEQFVDLCLIDCETFFHETACGRAHWLGGEQLVGASEIRLHAHPMDWLDAGCRGVAHVCRHSRDALKDLLTVERVRCNRINTVTSVWERLADDDGYTAGR